MPLERAYINASDAPTPLAYSHAVKMGSLLFISGQLPVDRQRRLVAPAISGGRHDRCWKT